MVRKVNVNVNVDLCFTLSCELVGRLQNIKRSKLYTAHTPGHWRGGRWSEKCQLGRCTDQRWGAHPQLTLLTSPTTPSMPQHVRGIQFRTLEILQSPDKFTGKCKTKKSTFTFTFTLQTIYKVNGTAIWVLGVVFFNHVSSHLPPFPPPPTPPLSLSFRSRFLEFLLLSFFVHLINPSIDGSIHYSIHPSIHHSIDLPIDRSIHLSIYPSIHLST